MSEFRERDIEIAKVLGWRVAADEGLYDHKGNGIAWAYDQTLEEALEEHAPHYSTDLRDCAGLLVSVQGRGWFIYHGYIQDGRAFFAMQKYGMLEKGFPVTGISRINDPQLAYCDAVSQACLEALKAEAKS